MPTKFYSTRFEQLKFGKQGRGLWRIFFVENDSTPSCVGPFYASKIELLADLDRYATGFGLK